MRSGATAHYCTFHLTQEDRRAMTVGEMRRRLAASSQRWRGAWELPRSCPSGPLGTLLHPTPLSNSPWEGLEAGSQGPWVQVPHCLPVLLQAPDLVP